MSPYFQNPLDLGSDIVVHSSTKYINGHSDVIGGILITNDDEIHSKLRYIQKAVGAVPSPFDCWLILRATKTLAVRMKQHNENAVILANYLKDKAEIKKVFYPGLTEHPQHELAKSQMRGFACSLIKGQGAIVLGHVWTSSLSPWPKCMGPRPPHLY